MEENKAQTTHEESAVGAVAGTETSEAANTATDESVSTAAFEDTGAESGDAGKEPPAGKPTQSAEENRAFAQRRREREQLISETRTKTFIEALGGKNPFNNEEMKDEADVEEYLLMKQIEREGGDPLTDFSKYRKKRDRDAAEARRLDAEKRAWYTKDREAFAQKHPAVDFSELTNDEGFQSYAAGKVGTVPLADIYEGYQKLVGQTEARARDVAAQALANRQASPGGLGASSTAESDFFTAAEVRKMSPADVHKNYEKIRKSMTKW